MTKIQMEELWKLFVQKVAVDAFGEKEVIEGKRIANLYGSVEAHKKIFLKAAEELFPEDQCQTK